MLKLAGISVPDLDVKRPACEYTPQAGLFLLVAITAIPEFALSARRKALSFLKQTVPIHDSGHPN
jgi:hypothetical protein